MKKEFKVGYRVRCIKDSWYKSIEGKVGTVIKVDNSGLWVGVEFDENINGHDCLGIGKPNHCWNVSSDELELVNKEVIVIYRKDREIIAHNKATGEKATAKCHPDDKFDFLTGAKVAFDRLVNPIKIVKQDKYEVGDKVKIIDEWVDGCDENCSGRMNKWLGKTMTIRKIDCDGDYRMEEDESENQGSGWYWNSKCIEGKVVDTTEPKSEPKPEPKKLYNGKVVCVEKSCFGNHETVGKIYEFKDGVSRYDDGRVFPFTRKPYESFEQLCETHGSKFIEVVE